MEFEAPLSCCDWAAGSRGTPQSLYCRLVTAHSMSKASRQSAVIGSIVCNEGRTAGVGLSPDSMALCICIGSQAAAPPVNAPQPEGTGKMRAKVVLPVIA